MLQLALIFRLIAANALMSALAGTALADPVYTDKTVRSPVSNVSNAKSKGATWTYSSRPVSSTASTR